MHGPGRNVAQPGGRDLDAVGHCTTDGHPLQPEDSAQPRKCGEHHGRRPPNNNQATPPPTASSDPADPDEIGFLVTLRADLSDQDADAAAQSIAEVPGVVAVRRYVADPSSRAAVELNDSRWRESICTS